MSRPQYRIQVEPDQFTADLATKLDYDFKGESVFEGWEKPEVPKIFRIGLIVGPSGSGKSLLLREFGQEKEIQWDTNRAIVSHFASPEDAIDRLMAVGLNSIPSWCRPFHVLSNGEQFRANLARRLHDNAIVDEFTSVVDRNVAKATSVAVRRAVERYNMHGLVFASCHYDILEWLRPDWYFDTATGILHDGRLLQRPPIEIRIYRCSRSVWSVFAKHHYLTPALNQSCHAYLATARFGEETETVVGFASAIAQPMAGNATKRTKKAYREHRTVILPDFQGLGIGPRLSDAIAQRYLDEGKRYFSKTSHIRFGSYRDKEGSGWIRTCKNRLKRDDIAAKRKRLEAAVREGKTIGWGDYDGDSKRICFSHEFIGKHRSGETGCSETCARRSA